MANAYDTDPRRQRIAQAEPPPDQPPPDDDQPIPAGPPGQPPPDQLPPVVGGNFLGTIGAYVPPPPSPAPDSEEERWRQRTQPPQEEQQGPPPPSYPPPYRENRTQFYIPQSANRGPWGWGEERQYPMEPQPWEVNGIYRGVGNQMGMFGWPRLALWGTGLGKLIDAFVRGYQGGQSNYTREQERQIKMYRDAMDREMQETIEEYSRTFREYGDPSNLEAIPPAKQKALEAAIEAIASQKNDNHMLNALHNNHLQGVIDQLNYLDAKHGDLKAAKRTQEKDEEKRDNEDPWFHEGGTHGTGNAPVQAPDVSGTPPPRATEEEPATPETGDDPLQAKPGEEAPAPDLNADPAAPAAKPAAPAAAPAPQSQAAPTQQQAQAAPQQPPEAQQPQAGAQLAQRGDVMSDAPQPGVGGQQVAQAQVPAPPAAPQEQPIVSPALDEMQRKHKKADAETRKSINDFAEQSLIAGKYVGPKENKHPEVSSYIYKRWGEMQRDLNSVLRAPAPQTPQEKKAWLDRLNALSPRIAGAVEGYSKGTMAPSVRSTARGVQEWLRPLTSKYDSTIGDDNFYVRKAVKISFGSGKDGQALTATGTAYLHLKQYHDDLEQFSKLDYKKQQALKLIGTSGWISPDFKEQYLGITGEDVALVGRLNNDEHFVANEVERAITGGVPHVGPTKTEAATISWTQDIRGALAVTEDSRRKLEARIRSQQLRFNAFVGPNAGNMGKLFDDYARLGTPAGEEPATPESNAIVRDAIKTGTLPPFESRSPAAAPTAPSAPAPAPAAPRVTPAAPRSALPQADDARAWARAHPEDPRAKQILERLGQ